MYESGCSHWSRMIEVVSDDHTSYLLLLLWSTYCKILLLLPYCDLIAHTVLLYVLFCLTNMCCTLYALYRSHTVHSIHALYFPVSDDEVSPSTSVHSQLFVFHSVSFTSWLPHLLTKHHLHSLSYRALYHRGSVTISILDWYHFDFYYCNIRSVCDITFRQRCQEIWVTRERLSGCPRSHVAVPLSLSLRPRDQGPADRPPSYLFKSPTYLKSPQLLRPEVSEPLQRECLHLEERREGGWFGHLPLRESCSWRRVHYQLLNDPRGSRWESSTRALGKLVTKSNKNQQNKQKPILTFLLYGSGFVDFCWLLLICERIAPIKIIHHRYVQLTELS